MHWGSWSNFFAMGGRGFYVWGAYLITLICILAELALLARNKRTLRRRLTQMLRLNKQS
jgi:heme exporter protein D